jgi:NodT family efflux transporter outer membrane factor (OMF) lipoprotein
MEGVSHVAPSFRRVALRACAAVLAVAACSQVGCMTGVKEYFRNGLKVGPNYAPPAAAVEDDWIDKKRTDLSEIEQQYLRAVTNQEVRWDWWRVYNDPLLTELVTEAHEQNLTLREAGFRVQEARYLRAVAVGSLLPQQQTFSGAYQRRQISLGTGIVAGGGGGFPGVKRQFSVWGSGLQMAWEVDFWGRFRRGIEAADANLDASVENYDDVMVILVSDVASTYLEIRTLQQRIKYAKANVTAQQGSVDTVEKLVKAGSEAPLALAQPETNVNRTQAAIPQLEAVLRQAENRLCVLLGTPPRDLRERLGMLDRIPIPPPQVGIGIPADLLRRRPDVRRAEREVAAQSARIGIAEADLYPAFTINGQIGLQASQFADLFHERSINGSIGPSFNWNILNYGRIRNSVRAEEALFMQLATRYQNLVLTANQEAEDALVAYLQAHQQVYYQRKAAAAALAARKGMLDKVVGGKANVSDLFVVDATLAQEQDLLAVAEGTLATSLTDLYRALGGGWQLRLDPPPPAEELFERKQLPPLPDVEMPSPGPVQPAPLPIPEPAPQVDPAPQIDPAPNPEPPPAQPLPEDSGLLGPLDFGPAKIGRLPTS